MNHERYLTHYGIKGQKWYVRRFQNKDGSLTPAGQKRYNEHSSFRNTYENLNVERSAAKYISEKAKLAKAMKNINNMPKKEQNKLLKKMDDIDREHKSNLVSNFRNTDRDTVEKYVKEKNFLGMEKRKTEGRKTIEETFRKAGAGQKESEIMTDYFITKGYEEMKANRKLMATSIGTVVGAAAGAGVGTATGGMLTIGTVPAGATLGYYAGKAAAWATTPSKRNYEKKIPSHL